MFYWETSVKMICMALWNRKQAVEFDEWAKTKLINHKKQYEWRKENINYVVAWQTDDW